MTPSEIKELLLLSQTRPVRVGWRDESGDVRTITALEPHSIATNLAIAILTKKSTDEDTDISDVSMWMHPSQDLAEQHLERVKKYVRQVIVLLDELGSIEER